MLFFSRLIISSLSLINSNFIGLQNLVEEGCGFSHTILPPLNNFNETRLTVKTDLSLDLTLSIILSESLFVKRLSASSIETPFRN